MGRSKAQCAADRVARRECDIRGHLAAGNTMKALWAAVNGLMAEAKQLWESRPADGVLSHADLAGVLLRLQASLADHRPARPPGCPEIPRSRDLLAVFDSSFYGPAEEGAG